MYEPIFENSEEILYDQFYVSSKKQIETVRDKTIRKLAPLCPSLNPETFALMFANAWHESYEGVQKLANDLDIYKLEIFAIEDDIENFNYFMEQEKYLNFDGDY